MRFSQTSENTEFDPGQELCAWEAANYHPHRRGWVWITIFSLVVFGIAAWALVSKDWVMAFTFFVLAGVYFLVHRKEDESHQVRVFERGLLIDQKYLPFEKFEGFWFVYDQGVSVVNLQLKSRNDRKISLQMGQQDPSFFREVFDFVAFPELEDRTESLLDIWTRALQL